MFYSRLCFNYLHRDLYFSIQLCPCDNSHSRLYFSGSVKHSSLANPAPKWTVRSKFHRLFSFLFRRSVTPMGDSISPVYTDTPQTFIFHLDFIGLSWIGKVEICGWFFFPLSSLLLVSVSWSGRSARAHITGIRDTGNAALFVLDLLALELSLQPPLISLAMEIRA